MFSTADSHYLFIESANIHYRWTYLDNQSLIRIKQKRYNAFLIYSTI